MNRMRRDQMDARVWPTLLAGDFTLIGPAAWSGTRALGSRSFDPSGRLYQVTLDHRAGSVRLLVENTLRRDLVKMEIDIDDRGFTPSGSVVISVDGAPQSLRFFQGPATEPGAWAAVGQVGAVGLGVEAQGLQAEQVELVSGVDPRLYRQ